eukprot:365123-Chlamydomonas_euryale.AAC.16
MAYGRLDAESLPPILHPPPSCTAPALNTSSASVNSFDQCVFEHFYKCRLHFFADACLYPIHVWDQNDWGRRQIRTFDEGFLTPCQEPSQSVILTGIPTRTTARWDAAGSRRAATIPVIEAFDPYVNWPLECI